MEKIRTFHLYYPLEGSNQLAVKDWKVSFLHLLWIVSTIFLLGITNADADMVFNFQKKMADKGNVEAQFIVGESYETGRGVKQNLDEAISWFNKAYKKGHVESGYKLLYLSIKKDGLTPGNKNKAKDLSSKGKSGDAIAQYYLGLMYHNGVGLKKSFDKALAWYKKAALQGITVAEQGIESVRMAQGKLEAAQAKRKIDAKKKAALIEKRKAEKIAEANTKKASTKKALAIKARKDTQAKRATSTAQARTQELKRQALIKARLNREKSNKENKTESEEQAEFESDPCLGKSARFLSTCR